MSMTRNQRITTVCALALLALAALPLAASSGKVNINAASVDELALLPRVGATVAQRIVDFREANGRFTEPESLMLVEGIGERTFALIEPWITLDGETTLTEKVRVARAGGGSGSGR